MFQRDRIVWCFNQLLDMLEGDDINWAAGMVDAAQKAALAHWDEKQTEHEERERQEAMKDD